VSKAWIAFCVVSAVGTFAGSMRSGASGVRSGGRRGAGSEWVPRFRGWRRGSSIEGMERSFWSMEKKKEGIGKLLEIISSPI
jgi:hypothetical protein